jgi:hypothetical protein
MKPELQQIFDNTPEDGPRSKLEPYRELILRWRRQRKSYRRITKLLAEKCGVHIGRTALNEFVQRRLRPRKLGPQAEGSTAISGDAPVQLLTVPAPTMPYPQRAPERTDLPPANSQQIASTDKYAADRERMRRHKAQPMTPQPEKRFSYTDEDSLKPL